MGCLKKNKKDAVEVMIRLSARKIVMLRGLSGMRRFSEKENQASEGGRREGSGERRLVEQRPLKCNREK